MLTRYSWSGPRRLLNRMLWSFQGIPITQDCNTHLDGLTFRAAGAVRLAPGSTNSILPFSFLLELFVEFSLLRHRQRHIELFRQPCKLPDQVLEVTVFIGAPRCLDVLPEFGSRNDAQAVQRIQQRVQEPPPVHQIAPLIERVIVNLSIRSQ